MSYYYTYRITCNHPDSIEKYYYGFRKSKTQHPNNDVYWSSSKYVKEAILKYGIQYFSKKIIKIFDIAEDAIKHESKLHERLKVDKHRLFFNKCRSTVWGFRTTGLILSGKTYEEIHGDEKAILLRQQRSDDLKKYRKDNPESVKGKNNPNYGNKWSDGKKETFASKRQKSDHPCYGLIWINNGHDEKKISSTEDLPINYVVGRVKNNKSEEIRNDFINSNLTRKEYAKKYEINYSTLKKYLKGL